MIRGVQRKMIVIRNIDGRLFDEAHFILKTSVKETESEKDELLREANRIISEHSYPACRKKRKKYSHKALILSFFCGLVLSAALCILVYLVAA